MNWTLAASAIASRPACGQRPTGRRRPLATVARCAILLAGLLAVGCATIQTDIVYDTVPGQSSQELETIELQLVQLRAVPDMALLASLRARLQELNRLDHSDPLLQARGRALAAEAALLAGNRREAQAQLDGATAAYAGDELSALVAARLELDPAARIVLLQAALTSSDTAWRLRAELGASLLEAGRYREALAAFDAALPRLPAEYGQLHQAGRDRAYALRDSEGAVQAAAASHLTPQPISYLGLIVVVQQESNLLEWFTGGAPWSPGVIFERAKAAGWFADGSLPAGTPATRADVALFIWNLIARGQSNMLRKYSTRYAGRTASPVPDVAIGSPWFDAVLGVVEEDIMTLPDGRNFQPETPVSGLEFFGIMTAAAGYR
ncbi:MAG: hypothetical protein A2087_03010 [Spirochaetes bacterium GWD1_61_31]|nr:MAG: hypothetical protein A2Y37_14105 [Spirochaetes bacterium GWB1_60_80]OHD34727.1 MAG: hypothetical protein A2004_00150 [Spirochaetes bacterium GWC1_61_12]OHD38739.1 MAG: hypothetical protein A2087_03010 [Spirochaetes bacterium GWD1_61_31]OHD44484.1 MAG: hypothetical protein A2Y35_04945 [Spirochaetes bacterium GWE1_60_18]OHD59366.1 MAG: hypothetical protein A2Y32_08550 [Spirochaetes bacterium GWF1_60_12]HAP43134.1 hypothetical protein [Spirochaetaceae bacterium]